MRYVFAVILFYCAFTLTAFAQTTYGVKGIVADTAAKIKVDKATIAIIDAKDSTFVNFAYADKGVFNITGLQPGKYLLMATFPDYADFVEPFALDAAHPVKDFGNIGLILRSRLLADVMIKAKTVPVTIKGDTTIFNAASYATQKNAKVDDILKQLPGMRINQSGVIIFQGEVVSKILVDGEEFFSDDPTLVSKTIRADMVNKIKVYQDKTDEAKRTGVDDGKKVTVANLVLREDKRNGNFGKLEADRGNGRYYAGQGGINQFSPKEKVALYGNAGTTGKVGLSGSDASTYGGSSVSYFGGDGYPLARDGGALYTKKFNKDKQEINATYKIGALDVDGAGSSFTQNNLPGNFNKITNERLFHNYNFRQSVNGSFNTSIDSTSTLNFIFSGDDGNSNYNNSSTSSTVRGNDILQNANNTSSYGSSENKSYYLYTYYNKSFKKQGRRLSISVSHSDSKSTSRGYQLSDLNYYDSRGVLTDSTSVDQYKPTTSNAIFNSANLTFSDKLFKSLSVSIGYNYSQSDFDRDVASFNKSASGLYDQRDNLFSNHYLTSNQANGYTINLTFNKGKSTININNTTSAVNLNQTDKLTDTTFSRNFVNWRPYASYRINLTKAASLSFDYSGNTVQPSISQLQPLRQNSDLLNIYIGNSKLKPEFNNRWSFNYRLYKPTIDGGLNLRGNYANKVNAIMSNRLTDSAGVNTYQSVNLSDQKPSSWYLYSEVYFHVKKLGDALISPSFIVNGNIYYNYINQQLNKTKSVTYNPGVSIAKNKPNYSYSFDMGANFTENNTSLQTRNNNTRNYFVHLNLYTQLPFKFFIGDEAGYQYNTKNAVFDHDFEQLLLKVWFGKTFLKNESLKASIIGTDLFNQNTGYSRNGNADSFTESRSQVIGRYFMFSLTWDFSHFKKTLQKQTP